MPVDPLLQGLLAGFLIETQELISKITRDLLELERASAPGPALEPAYENIARNLHTLKGSAATLGLEDCSALAHKMEDVVAPLRSALSPFPAQTMDDVLRGLDSLLGRVRAHSEGKGDELPDVATLMAGLVKHAVEEAAAPATAALAAELEPEEQTRPPAPPVAAAKGPGKAAPRKLEPVEESFELESDEHASWRVSTTQVVSLMREVERLREVRLRIDERRREVERVLARLAKLSILNETAEVRAMLMGANRSLAADGEETADIVDALEQGVKEICTLPVRTILDPLHRAVRDLCRATGKECRLSIVGAEVSLDRRVLEVLRGPDGAPGAQRGRPRHRAAAGAREARQAPRGDPRRPRRAAGEHGVPRGRRRRRRPRSRADPRGRPRARSRQRRRARGDGRRTSSTRSSSAPASRPAAR